MAASRPRSLAPKNHLNIALSLGGNWEMKRSRASLMMFLMTICCALHVVGWSNSRAATTDVRPLKRLCTANWSPLGDCRADAASSVATLAANGNIDLIDSGQLDACHPEALHCSYQSSIDYQPGVDCYGAATASASHEVDSPPIEEYVYGELATQTAPDVAIEADQTDCYCEYGCPDEFDCGLVYVPKVYLEDLSQLASDPRHSTGLQLAVDINAANDGLAEARHSVVRQSIAPRIAANVGANYDYGDSSGECYEEDCSDDRLAHDLADLCGAGHCLAQTSDEAPVVSLDEEPLDLPPTEPAAVDPAEYGYDNEYNYEDDYSYNAADEYNYENDYSYGYEDDYSYAATSEQEAAPADDYGYVDDYGYGYTDDEEYAYDASQEPGDLPPAEQVIDDLPPGEALTDDVPAGETVPAQASYGADDVERYGDYREARKPVKAWVEPGCDEQQSYDAQDWCDGLTDDERSWGVGREYRRTAEVGEEPSREALRSTARWLNRLGQSLVNLARSLDDQIAPVAESQPQSIMPAQELYPWPATIGRHPKIDPPLGL
jgi:hypothetical protein